MLKKNVEELVEGLVTPMLAGTSLELVDVEYVRERDWYLRVFLDKEGGLEIDDCQNVSEKLAALLDEQDFIKERYYLEVSSPGLDRKLRKERDFLRHKGEMIDVKMQDDKKVMTGELGDCTQDILRITVDGKIEELERGKISWVRLHLTF